MFTNKAHQVGLARQKWTAASPGSSYDDAVNADSPLFYDSGSHIFAGDGLDLVALPGGLTLTAGSPVTIEFEFNVAAADSGQTGSAFTIGDTDAPNRCQAHVPYAGVLYWDYGNYGINGRVSTSLSGYYDSWVHAALVSTGAGNTFMAAYLNGLVTTFLAASSGPTSNISGGYIGKFFGFPHKGGVRRFAVYDRVLTPTRISAHVALR